MMVAIAVSVVAHAGLLAVRFVAPDAFRLEPADPGLEVILVNAKHARRPLKADALAQANLDGGGQAEAGRAKSPLPDMRRSEDGDSIKAAQRRIAELQEMQQNLLTRARASAFNAAPVTDKDKPDPTRTGADLVEASKAIARAAAEINTRIEDENRRPKKTYITPSTRRWATPCAIRRCRSGSRKSARSISLRSAATSCTANWCCISRSSRTARSYLKDGGVRVEKSSGNPALDRAALAIVPPRRRSANSAEYALVRQGRPVGDHHPLQVHPRASAESGPDRRRAMSDHYCVIGNPVEHSKSPAIHAAFAQQTGNILVYEKRLAPLDGFAATVRELVARGYRTRCRSSSRHALADT
jgi:protein TonB